MCIIRVVGGQSEFLAIKVLRRLYPDCTDWCDGNWLAAEVDIAAGGFVGNVRGDLRAEELARFHEQLCHVQTTLRGVAECATMERWLSMRIEATGLGHVTIEGSLRDDIVDANTLNFRFGYDQTYLQPMLAQLAAVVRRFPILGHGPASAP